MYLVCGSSSTRSKSLKVVKEVLSCKAKRQYLPTLQVSRYCLLALLEQSSRAEYSPDRVLIELFHRLTVRAPVTVYGDTAVSVVSRREISHTSRGDAKTPTDWKRRIVIRKCAKNKTPTNWKVSKYPANTKHFE